MSRVWECDEDAELQVWADPERPKIVREPLPLLQERGAGEGGFILHNVLSPKECESYIAQTNDLGYKSLEKLFAPTYRNQERCILINEELSTLLWDRIEDHFSVVISEPNQHLTEAHSPHPSYGVPHGKFTPIGLNPCLRFGKYPPGGIFRRHPDAFYVANHTDRSLMTLLLYLNDGFEGGETRFHSQMVLDDDGEYIRDGATADVRPRAGSVVVFFHGIHHESLRIGSGHKYFMRTDVMYRRYPELLNPRTWSWTHGIGLWPSASRSVPPKTHRAKFGTHA